MIVAIYQREWFAGATIETVRVDPTRMAQGIMTGIGFLGCRGDHEGKGIDPGADYGGIDLDHRGHRNPCRGGFLQRIGDCDRFNPGHPDVVPFCEERLPMLRYIQTFIRFHRTGPCPNLKCAHSFMKTDAGLRSLCHAVTEDREFQEYDLVIRTRNEKELQRLFKCLSENEAVAEFRISPTG
jgi:putative Mg2+ transporter-C (MgtC) family protein